MKKFFKAIFYILMVIFIVSCSKKVTIEAISNREFTGISGGKIIVVTKGENRLFFQNVHENASDKNLNNLSKVPKTGAYNNPKLFYENGKAYLTADDLDYKFLVKSEVQIIDEADNNYEYKDLSKSK